MSEQREQPPSRARRLSGAHPYALGFGVDGRTDRARMEAGREWGLGRDFCLATRLPSRGSSRPSAAAGTSRCSPVRGSCRGPPVDRGLEQRPEQQTHLNKSTREIFICRVL